MRILGSADKHFRTDLNRAIRSHALGTSTAAKLPLSVGPELSSLRMYTHANYIGHKIPENFYRLLGNHFTPRVVSNGLLIVADASDIYVPGKIETIYS